MINRILQPMLRPSIRAQIRSGTALRGSGVATGSRLRVVVWCQGESDPAEGYAPQLYALVNNMRSDYGDFLFVILEHNGGETKRAEQRRLATGSGDPDYELDKCLYVPTPAGAVVEPNDPTHFTGDANILRAQAVIAAIKASPWMEYGYPAPLKPIPVLPDADRNFEAGAAWTSSDADLSINVGSVTYTGGGFAGRSLATIPQGSMVSSWANQTEHGPNGGTRVQGRGATTQPIHEANIGDVRQIMGAVTTDQDWDELRLFANNSTDSATISNAQLWLLDDVLGLPLDIWIIMGQSNAAGASSVTGMDTATQLPFEDMVYIPCYRSTAWGTRTDQSGPSIHPSLSSPQGIGQPTITCEPVQMAAQNAEGLSIAVEIMRGIVSEGFTPIGRAPVLIGAAHGATSIAVDWAYTDAANPGPLMALAKANIDAALNYTDATTIEGGSGGTSTLPPGETTVEPGYFSDAFSEDFD